MILSTLENILASEEKIYITEALLLKKDNVCLKCQHHSGFWKEATIYYIYSAVVSPRDNILILGGMCEECFNNRDKTAARLYIAQEDIKKLHNHNIIVEQGELLIAAIKAMIEHGFPVDKIIPMVTKTVNSFCIESVIK